MYKRSLIYHISASDASMESVQWISIPHARNVLISVCKKSDFWSKCTM